MSLNMKNPAQKTQNSSAGRDNRSELAKLIDSVISPDIKSQTQNSVALIENRLELAKFINEPAGVNVKKLSFDAKKLSLYFLLRQKAINQVLSDHAASSQTTPCSVNDLIGQAWDKEFTAAGSSAILALGRYLKLEVQSSSGGGSPEVAWDRILMKAAVAQATNTTQLQERIDKWDPAGSGSVADDLKIQMDVAERAAAAEAAAAVIKEQISKYPLFSLSQAAIEHCLGEKLQGALDKNHNVIELAQKNIASEAKTVVSRKTTKKRNTLAPTQQR